MDYLECNFLRQRVELCAFSVSENSLLTRPKNRKGYSPRVGALTLTVTIFKTKIAIIKSQELSN